MEQDEAQRIFLDYASTTPVDERVLRLMQPYFSESFANPSALYKEAVFAKEAVETSRMEIARLLHSRVDEIFFTGSGTESDNMAIIGTFKKAKTLRISNPHIVTTAIEHPAVLEACRALEGEGAKVSYIGVSSEGIVDPHDIAKVLNEDTVLVTVMLANNEIGTIQPVAQIARVVREFKEKNKRGKFDFPFMHVDASQAPNYLSCSVDSLGSDLMTLDGSKIYGPKGIGLLFVKKGISLEPIFFGGGQEGGLRSGTENVAFIVGFAKALSIAIEERKYEYGRLLMLRDSMIEEIMKKFPAATLNGSKLLRLPNNINMCFPGLDSEFAVIKLDQKGICVSYSSSCRTLAENSNSYVIEALNRKECAASSLRFTLGRETTKEHIDAALRALIDIK